MSDWRDDETFWRAMAPALCAPGRVAAAEDDVTAVLRAVNLGPQGAALDLGCGPGAHAIAMAARGYRINIFFSKEDGGYIADIPDPPQCAAFGEASEEALAEVLKAKAAWVEAAKCLGLPGIAPLCGLPPA